MKSALKSTGAFVAGVWVSLPLLVQILLALQVLDIIGGTLAAFYRKNVAADESFRGCAKKVVALVLVGGAHVAERVFAVDLPLGAIVAGFYCVHEMISLCENAALVGLPLPAALLDALTRAKSAAPRATAQSIEALRRDE